MGLYIRNSHVENLSKYRYSGLDKSLLSQYVLRPYWRRLVELFPTTVAPNLITLTGFAFVIINFITLLYYTPDLQTECPRWVYASWSIGLFLYQSFDAIDGMQARRTGTSGPLGQCFDHCCDAMNTTLECILTAAALGLGQSWATVACQFATLCNFYLSTWEEWHTGTLYLSYFSGPVEGIVMVTIFYGLTALFGPSFWARNMWEVLHLPAPTFLPSTFSEMTLQYSFLVFGGVGLIGNVLASASNVHAALRVQKKPFLPALAGLLPFFGTSFLVYVWLSARPELVTEHLIPLMLFIGAVLAYMVGLMIISHVSHQSFPHFNILLLPIIYASLDSTILPLLFSLPSTISPSNSPLYVLACLGLAMGVYGSFVMDICTTMCDYFGIRVLSTKKIPGFKKLGKGERGD
ncbi:Phosphotransferase [Saitoella coloradoensis]